MGCNQMPATSSTVLGIDTLAAAGSAALANAQSPAFLGASLSFWGRYFYAPGQRNSQGKKDTHYSAAENGFLRANGIRLLPIARQTGNVGGSAAKGVADAKNNVDAIFETIAPSYLAGADPNALVFLDVEQGNPLATDYYAGWADTLANYSSQLSNGHVRFRPAIYAGPKNAKTWKSLSTAMNNGSGCFGAWIARYYHGSPVPAPWDDSLVAPVGKGPFPPLLAWQYWASADDAAAAFNFDTSIVNGLHADVLQDGLIMPPQ